MASESAAGKQPGRRSGAMTINVLSDREIELVRVFAAPRALVFEAISRPEHVRLWWGTRGSEMVRCEMDFRPGGKWRYLVREADGTEHAFRGEYREIQPPERIVQSFEYEGMPGAISVETLVLTERDGITALTSTSRFDSMEARDGMLQSGMERGAAETYDRLEELLRTIG